MAIRYSKEFNKEIRQVVNNFNNKIKRLERNEQEIIPDKESISELKQIYQDRRQLKRKLRQLKDFSKRGAEEVIITPGGAEMTKWEFETGKADYSMVKRRIKKRVEKYPQKQASPYLKDENLVTDETKLAEMQSAFKNLTADQLRRIKATIDTELKAKMQEDIFKENLLKRLRGSLISQGYDPSLIDRFESFTGEQLLQIYKNEQYLADIMDFGDTEGNKRKITVFKNRSGATLDESDFNNILQKMITSISYYELEYKK